MEDKLLKQILSEVQGVHTKLNVLDCITMQLGGLETRMDGLEIRMDGLASGQKELYLLSRGWEEDRHILRHLEEKFILNQGNQKRLEKRLDAIESIIGRHDVELQELKNQSA